MQDEGKQTAVEQGNNDTSAVTEHVWNKDHKVDWGGAEEDLDMHTKEWYMRCVIESWEIQFEPAAINRDQGIMPQNTQNNAVTQNPSLSFFPHPCSLLSFPSFVSTFPVIPPPTLPTSCRGAETLSYLKTLLVRVTLQKRYKVFTFSHMFASMHICQKWYLWKLITLYTLNDQPCKHL